MPSQAAAIGERLRREVANVCKMIALEIDKELRRRTPVDTGHARRNWIPSVGVPARVEAKDDRPHAEGVAAVLSYQLADGALWVANNVPYIRRLNYGHSSQAPAGFVEMAIDAALARVARKVKNTAIDVTAMRSSFQSEVGGSAAENLASAYDPFGGDW